MTDWSPKPFRLRVAPRTAPNEPKRSAGPAVTAFNSESDRQIDAELNAAEDKKKLELVQARNQGEASVHSVKKSLTEHGDKIEAAEKEAIEKAIKELEEVLTGEDKDAIDSKTEALMTASQKLGEKVYAEMQAQQAAAGAGAAEAKPQDDNVVDAEVKEVKKD